MEYTVEATYEGFNPEIDAAMRIAAGIKEDGAGYGFGERDMVWRLGSATAARAMAKRLRTALGTVGKVVIRSDQLCSTFRK